MQPDQTQTSGSWTFHPEETASKTEPHEKQDTHDPVTWTASEFVAHHKSAGWYFGLLAGTAAVTGLVYLFTRDAISAVSIGVVGILFAILSSKKPRQLSYAVDSRGIHIGDKLYPYGVFKSFSIQQEGVLGYISLLPLKRFMPEISVYFPPENGDEIVKILSNNLPYEHRQEQSIDRLMKRMRF
jgi:hypothetical protein